MGWGREVHQCVIVARPFVDRAARLREERDLKMAFIGAGSVVFTKNLLTDVFYYPELHGSTIALHDIDPERLQTAGMMVQWTSGQLAAGAKVEEYLDLDRALEGCRSWSTAPACVPATSETSRHSAPRPARPTRQSRTSRSWRVGGKPRAPLSRRDARPSHFKRSLPRRDSRHGGRAHTSPRRLPARRHSHLRRGDQAQPLYFPIIIRTPTFCTGW